MPFLFSIFFGYLRGDTPILKASLRSEYESDPRERGACLMIIFHQFFLPDLYYYPTSSNLTESHAHIISQRSSLLPSWGGHGVGQNRKRRDGER